MGVTVIGMLLLLPLLLQNYFIRAEADVNMDLPVMLLNLNKKQNEQKKL